MLQNRQDVIEHLDDYLHELLSPDDAAVVRRFCEEDPVCRDALSEAEQRLAALRALPRTEATQSLVRETLEGLAAKPAKRRPWQIQVARFAGAVAIAASITILAFHIHFLRLRPTKHDLRILGQQQFLAGSFASLRVGVFDKFTGRSLDGIPVTLAIARSDSDEPPRVLATWTPSDGQTESPRFQLPDDDGTYELRVSADVGDGREQLARSIRVRRSHQVMVNTDKPVYQPGQTIHIRALSLRQPTLEPLRNSEVTFSVRDSNSNVILKQTATSSRFGIAAVDCPLATEILEGPYEVEVRAGDTVSSRTVEVQKYVLPKFKINLQLDQSFYQPGQQVQGSVQCDYFFGQPVIGGDVKLQVFTREVEVAEVVSLNVRTDDAGHATFAFQLPGQFVGRPQDSGDARFEVFATVTDSAGQTSTTKVSRVVTRRPIQLKVIPESSRLVEGIESTIYVFANYADGRPAQVDLEIANVDGQRRTDEFGLASFQLTPRQGEVRLSVAATDADGLTARQAFSLQCGGVASEFLLRPDQAVYRGGDSMTLTVLGGGVEPVFVDLIKDGQTVLNTTIRIADGRGELVVDLPPEVFGALQLVAYRFGIDGLPVRNSRTIFVRQAREITIAATLDRDEYRPGDRATLRLALTDAAGDPMPGAVSLSIVDEAVFSVMNQSAHMAAAFFLLEEELLQPVYAIYNWTLDFQPGLPPDQRQHLERALFARTATSEAGGDAALGVTMASAPSAGVLQAVEAFGRNNSSDNPFTLTGETFSVKRIQVDQQRRVGLRRVTWAWVALTMSVITTGVIVFAISQPKLFLIIGGFGGVGLLLLTCMGMPFLMLGGMAPTMFSADGAVDSAMRREAMSASDGSESATPPRVRTFFPETLLWMPEIVTDDQGVASLEIDMADSITTWRATASAVSADGQLGGEMFPIRVFQPFFVDVNLPRMLTRNDEVTVPVVVYNYLDKPQTVAVKVDQEDWFEWINDDVETQTLSVELAAGEVRSVGVPIRVLTVGEHELQVTATGESAADAIRRSVEVVADGQLVEVIQNGVLSTAANFPIDVPKDAIPGSERLLVKLYPSTFSQLVEGLDGIFRRPYGCFEQTSSTTYPNVLALDYLQQTGRSVPAIEAQARQYIHLGYQRLVSFEVPGGGFDWYGRAPANIALTAYGLLEFEDMARVHNVDPQLIERTRRWLLAQRTVDGTWLPGDRLPRGVVPRGEHHELLLTAYVARAVFRDGQAADRASSTLSYLVAQQPGMLDDPYLLATVASAIAEIDSDHPSLAAFLERLDQLCVLDESRKHAFWQISQRCNTLFFGDGLAGDIETTALIASLFIKANHNLGSTRNALSWLIEQKDPRGTWHSTQATVLALKALLAGTGQALGGDQPRSIDLVMDDKTVETVAMAADQGDVMRQLDLSTAVTGGLQNLTIEKSTDTATAYQVVLRYHVPNAATTTTTTTDPLSIEIDYDRRRLRVDDTVTAVATITNNMTDAAPMVILDLPIPGGFEIEAQELDELQGSQKIDKYQLTPRQAIVYLQGLQPGEILKLRYRLRATMPVKVSVPPAQVYEYYDPQTKGEDSGTMLEAVEAI